MAILTIHQKDMKFQRLVQTLETKGNKILENVKTRWMSMLDPLNMIMAKYRLSLVVMQIDYFIVHVAKVIIFFKLPFYIYVTF
jgi:hypothetical protein